MVLNKNLRSLLLLGFIGFLLSIPYININIQSFYFIDGILLTLFDSRNNTSSLYLLSTLVQSQAAIFAVAIGIDSIVFQLTSTKYSSRLSYIYTNDSLSIWLLCGSSIFLDLILITFIPDLLSTFYFSLVILSFIFAVILYSYLIIHMYNTISLLSPSKVLSQIKKYNSEDKKEQILDLIHSSVEYHDIDFFNNCLEDLLNYLVSENMNLVISQNYKNENKISNCLESFSGLPRSEIEAIILELINVGKLSTKLEDNKFTVSIIAKIYDVFERIVPENYEDYISNNKMDSIIERIADFLIYCLKHDLEVSTIIGMNSLFEKGIDKLNDIKKSNVIVSDSLFLQTIYITHVTLLNSIINIGIVASEKRLEKASNASADIIKQFIEIYQDNNYTVNRNELLKISYIALYSAENRLELSTEKILVILESFLLYFSTKYYKEDKYLDLLNYTSELVLKMKEICIDNNFVSCLDTINQTFSKLDLQYYKGYQKTSASDK